MSVLYLDCSMGAAGDMLAASLLELLPNPEEWIAKLNALGLSGVEIKRQPAVRCGITGTHFSVTVHGQEEESHDHHHHEHTHDHHHHDDHEHTHAHHEPHHTHAHHSLQDVHNIINDLSVSESVRTHILAVYTLLADAESHAHGIPVSEIHFHEVGTLDAIADITAVCLLMEALSPEQVIASPVHVGSGQVRCAHGILPVPAPATAHILRDVPIYGGQIQGELCTPTGAALLKHFVTRFGEMPVLQTKAIGYGMGKKEFPAANCVRALFGQLPAQHETVAELCCNLDDMTPEAIAFAMERCQEAGALDVYTIPIGMKKCRPGTLFCVMCREDDKDRIVHIIFQHTTTLGIRENHSNRYTLNRRIETRETSVGTVRRKIAEGYGVSRMKYEYEDLTRIACEKGISLQEALELVDKE